MITQFKSTTHFQPLGKPVGNLTIGRGVVDGKPSFVAIIENRLTSGAIGVAECDKLASLFKVVLAQRAPLMLFIDSAGARVSEGLPALGAFRRMFNAALKCRSENIPLACVLGTHCFGGASMLAALCGTRYFNSHSKLAMSGPGILATAAGASVLDDSFRAIAEANIGQSGRIKLSRRHLPFEQVVSFVAPFAEANNDNNHSALQARLDASKPKINSEIQTIIRNDLNALYPSGYTVTEANGVLSGNAVGEGAVRIAIIGSVDRQLMTVSRANAMCVLIQKIVVQPTLPAALHVLIDCESHSSMLEDEKLMLSEYLTTLSLTLWELAKRGVVIETTVLGKLGGGIYVALAAASASVNLLYGAQIQLLPGKAIAAILGEADSISPAYVEYSNAGVAERELKLGLIER